MEQDCFISVSVYECMGVIKGGWFIRWVCDPFDAAYGNCWEFLVPQGFHSSICIVELSRRLQRPCVGGTRLDVTVHTCSADFSLWHYNSGETESRKPALNGHYHSTPVTLISWWASSHHSCYFPVPFSISTYPCLHQFPLAAWFCLFWEQTRTEKGRQPETQGDREKAKDDKSDTKGQRDARRKREGRERFYFSEKPLYSLALACYSKIPLASQYPEKICYNHLVSLLHPSFIDLSQPSLFQLVSKYTIWF